MVGTFKHLIKSSRYSFILVMALLTSCDKGRVFEQNQSLEKQVWPASEEVSFEFDITDTEAKYNFLINVRNNSQYPYSNLFLFIEMSAPDEKYYADTLQFTLADNTGRWTGSGVGSTWQNQFPLLEGVKLLIPGTYKVNIRHGMRQDTLKAISDVGLRVEVANEGE